LPRGDGGKKKNNDVVDDDDDDVGRTGKVALGEGNLVEKWKSGLG
jgi:hypothetical protein